MDRNLSRRVEVVFPIEQPDLKQRLIDEILATTLADNVKARELLPDGSYRRVGAGRSAGGAQPGAVSGDRAAEHAAAPDRGDAAAPADAGSPPGTAHAEAAEQGVRSPWSVVKDRPL